MQTLRDAATLAILILLVLTVRVSLDQRPIGIDLGSAAEAASDVEPVVESDPVAPALLETHRAQTASRALPPATTPFLPDESATERRQFVWEVDGRRIVVVLGDEPSADATPPSKTQAEPCHDSCKARRSC